MELRVPLSVYNKRHIGQDLAKTLKTIFPSLCRKTYRVPEKGKLVVWLDIVRTLGHFAGGVWRSRDGALVAPVFIYDSCVPVKMLTRTNPYPGQAHEIPNLEFTPLTRNSACFTEGNVAQTVRHFGFSETATNKIACALDMVPTNAFSQTAANGVRKLWVRALPDPVNEHAQDFLQTRVRSFFGSQDLCDRVADLGDRLVEARLAGSMGPDDLRLQGRGGDESTVNMRAFLASEDHRLVYNELRGIRNECKDLAGVNPCFRIFPCLHPNTGAMIPGPEWQILSYHVPGMSAFLPEVDYEDEARRRMYETATTMAAAKEMRHLNPEANIGDDDYILADVKEAVDEATVGKTGEREMRRVERINREGWDYPHLRSGGK
eukprot:jgi/Tetstr1/460304/TSEL_005604.t1